MGRKAQFTIVVERDEAGYYVADVIELPGCHTQAKSMDELMERLREAIELYTEVRGPGAHKAIVPPQGGPKLRRRALKFLECPTRQRGGPPEKTLAP